jgi:ornithine cyclodeaminase/alanine dehydrogenase-like protein (mu-crystallin family)
VSTRYLAPRKTVQAVLGAGYEAWFHLCALLDGGGTEQVYVWNRTAAKALSLVRRAREVWPAVGFIQAQTPADAARTADVITLITSSPQPLLTRRDVQDHVLINAMGSYQPHTREISSDVLTGARIYADTREGVLREAGDVLIPISEGVLSPDQVRPLQEALSSQNPGGVVVMKSVGAAVFDACALIALYEGWGHWVQGHPGTFTVPGNRT